MAQATAALDAGVTAEKRRSSVIDHSAFTSGSPRDRLETRGDLEANLTGNRADGSSDERCSGSATLDPKRG